MRIVLLLAALSLAGCATDAEQDAAACNGYGFTPGTSDYGRCMMARDQQRRAAAAAFLGMQMQQRPPAYQVPVYQMPVQHQTNTNCMLMGNMMNCQSY